MSKPKPSAAYGTTAPGVIASGELYIVDELRRRMQMGDWAWRQLLRSGLPVIRTGGRTYILADDLISFLAQSRTSSR